MSTDFDQIKPVSQLNTVLASLKDLYLEFESRKPEKIAVSCPFCDEEKPSLAFNYQNSEYQKCSRCHSIYLSPRITEEWLGKFYDFMQENFHFTIPETQRQVRIDKIMKPRWEMLSDKLDSYVSDFPVNRYMEVGPGVGYFTEVAQLNDCAKEYILVEPDKHCHDRLKELEGNIKVYDCTLEQCPIDECGEVDLIFINSVIEHPFSIDAFFAKLSALLKPNGIIVLVDMHAGGLDIGLLGDKAPNVNPYSILQIASIEGINQICCKNELSVKEVFSIGQMDVDILYEYARELDSGAALKGLENILKSKDLRTEIQNVLSKHLLTGYNGYLIQKNK